LHPLALLCGAEDGQLLHSVQAGRPASTAQSPPLPKVGSSSPLAATAAVAKDVSTSANTSAPIVVERIALAPSVSKRPDGRNARRLRVAPNTAESHLARDF